MRTLALAAGFATAALAQQVGSGVDAGFCANYLGANSALLAPVYGFGMLSYGATEEHPEAPDFMVS